MHIRKWLRILINRSLVLGTGDRPSVHDLVLDFAVAQHADAELRENHRRIVEAFRAARPADVHGRRKYEMSQRDDPCFVRVFGGGYHVSKGWEAEMEQDAVAVTEWLGDVPRTACAACRIGVGRESSFDVGGRVESRGDWWLAGRYYAVACVLKTRSEAAGNAGAVYQCS